MKFTEIDFLDIDTNEEYIQIINSVMEKCFLEENLVKKNLYVEVTLTNPKHIKEMNKKFRSIDTETDVLSFPIFEKDEIDTLSNDNLDVLGNIVISIPKVKGQALEYGHSFKRELAYMVVHGFYHLMGYDHIKEQDKTCMRIKEENILQKMNIID